MKHIPTLVVSLLISLLMIVLGVWIKTHEAVDKTFYFVSYSWYTKTEHGFGNCTFSVDGKNKPFQIKQIEKDISNRSGGEAVIVIGFQKTDKSFEEANK
jgi:hypothetical protein